MSNGTIHNINNIAELENPARVERHNFPYGQSTVADLVLLGTDYKFSDEFACVLGGPGEERDFA